MVVLRTANGFVKGPGGLNEPLAGNFSLYDGQVSLQVPDVPARTDYQAVCTSRSHVLDLLGETLTPCG